MINTLFSEREFIEYHKILYKNKLSSSNLNILIFEVKLTFQLVKQAHDNNKKVDIINFTLISKYVSQLITVLYIVKLQFTNSSVHRMFPDSLWLINVLHVCASAPISSGSASYQGTLSHFYPLCTQCVLHPSGTGSCILQTETGFKIQISISETLLEPCRYLIKPNSTYISIYFKVSKIIKRLKSLSFQNVNGEHILWLFSNLPYLFTLKFICKRPQCINTFYEKLKLGSFKTSLTISYEFIPFNTSAFGICSQKNYKNLLNLIILVIFNKLLLINAFSSHTTHGTYCYQ